MTHDPTLDVLGGLPMPTPDTRWPPLDLEEFDQEVRIVELDETYIPPLPPDPDPIGVLRHRQTWAERHRQDVDDLRLTLGRAQTELRDAIEGCRAVHYHDDVAEMIVHALDRTIEALRRMDIHDPE